MPNVAMVLKEEISRIMAQIAGVICAVIISAGCVSSHSTTSDWNLQEVDKMPVEVFRAVTPTKPVLFSVTAQLSDYYNYDFLEARKDYWSIHLETAGKSLGYGFIRKASDKGKSLFDLLKDGNPHSLIVAVKYGPDGEENCFYLTKWTEAQPRQAPTDNDEKTK